MIDRNINYTDICVSACKFCAFFKAPDDPAGSVLSREELLAKIRETQELGGTQVLLQGGLHPDLDLAFYEDMLRAMKATGIHVHGSPPEIHHFAEISGLTVRAVLERHHRRPRPHPGRRRRDSVTGCGANCAPRA